MRSDRSPTVQSFNEIGGNTATSTVPGFSVLESRAAMTSALRMTIGTIGIPADMAIRNGPFLNGPTSVVSSRVPSGAMTTDSPFFASSSTLRSDSTAERVSSRSMNTVSTSLPRLPRSGSLSSSFFPTPVQLSRTSAPVITGSKLLRWLKMNTAGRCAVKFSSPITLRFTPLVASSSAGQLEVKKFTPRRRLRVSRPSPSAPAATGNSEPTPTSVRNCPPIPPLPRLVNLRIGQPRRLATAAILPSGFVGRGLPTRYINATSSSPSA